jgi:uncharacterized delta-60 repeat protein
MPWMRRALNSCVHIGILLLLVAPLQVMEAGPAAAAAGGLDRSFGEDGRVTTLFGGSDSMSFLGGLAVQSDGEVVAAGATSPASVRNFKFALARYNLDGTLDDTFGGDGKVTSTFFSNESFANDVAIQDDGKIVAAGFTLDEVSRRLQRSRFALARYNSDGTLDRTFSGNGKVTTRVAARSRVSAVAIQPDGKIVVAGLARKNHKQVFALARYNTNGSLDGTFGDDGTLTTFLQFPMGQTDVAVQADGKIVLVGTVEVPDSVLDVRFAVLRYRTDGTLDPTFDGDGITMTRFNLSGRTDASANAVAIQPDGRIVVAGGYEGEGRNGATRDGFAVARYHSDGSLDGSFGHDGKVRTQVLSTAGASGLVIQPDGNVVAAGTVTNLNDPVPSRFATTRYEPDGSLDQAFGQNGEVKTQVGMQPQVADVALEPDGGIVVGGSTNDRFALVRYLAA